MVFKNLCVLVLWTKVASAFEGLMGTVWRIKGIWGNRKSAMMYKSANKSATQSPMLHKTNRVHGDLSLGLFQ